MKIKTPAFSSSLAYLIYNLMSTNENIDIYYSLSENQNLRWRGNNILLIIYDATLCTSCVKDFLSL